MKIQDLKNKKVAILGFGIEGKDLVRLLHDKVSELAICDIKPKEELDLTGIEAHNVTFYCGTNYLDWLQEFDVVFRSPGFYRRDKKLLEIEKKGVEVSSAIKLFFEECPAEIIGVTGTKGKGTTSTLIYEMLRNAGIDAYLAGNIGTPYLGLLPHLGKDSVVVLELSSFQLFDLEKSPHVAVVLNITTDHLDWHKNRKEYVDAKKNIVKHQTAQDYAVVNDDYDDSRSFARLTKAQILKFSKRHSVKGAYIKDKTIYVSKDEKTYELGMVSDLLLRGEHNWENIAAAVCAVSIYKVPFTVMKKIVFGFKGLEHRLELVETHSDISYYNDSFATGPDSVHAAVSSFDEPTTLILGGFDKGLNYDELAKFLAKRENLSVILIGDIAKKIEVSLAKAHFLGKTENMGKPTMQSIVKKAQEMTPTGGVVLLSPGSSSFDMFASYKERGNKFKEAVRTLSS